VLCLNFGEGEFEFWCLGEKGVCWVLANVQMALDL
jgi:hypothetical protein